MLAALGTLGWSYLTHRWLKNGERIPDEQRNGVTDSQSQQRSQSPGCHFVPGALVFWLMAVAKGVSALSL